MPYPLDKYGILVYTVPVGSKRWEAVMNQSIKATTSLPARIVTLYTTDAGPMENGGTRCPHCGAEGRYVHYFLCDDGYLHAAMSGCIKLFPHKPTTMSKMAELALEKEQALRDEQCGHSGTGRKLASWFEITLKALDDLKEGKILLWQADSIIREQYGKRNEWLRQKGYGRGRR